MMTDPRGKFNVHKTMLTYFYLPQIGEGTFAPPKASPAGAARIQLIVAEVIL